MGTLYKFELTRERLNSGGYTSYGRYFGTGQPLYTYHGEVESVTIDGEPTTKYKQGYLRANSREDAKAQIREMYPKARFYR